MECSRRGKVHSLIDKVYDPANLAEAWKRVRENKGSAGIDGLTVAGFEQRQDELLERLHKQLRREDLSALTGETGGDTKARGWNEKSRHSICPDRVVQQALVQKMNSHLRTAVCGLLVWISTRPIATYGDAEGVAGNPRGQLLDFRRRLARLL